jgi:hypothetical protein
VIGGANMAKFSVRRFDRQRLLLALQPRHHVLIVVLASEEHGKYGHNALLVVDIEIEYGALLR